MEEFCGEISMRVYMDNIERIRPSMIGPENRMMRTRESGSTNLCDAPYLSRTYELAVRGEHQAITSLTVRMG
jgi:hypothetical protein